MINHLKIYPKSRFRIIWTYLLIALILLCIYVGVFHMYYHSSESLFSSLLSLVACALFFLQKLWLDTSKMNWTRHLLSAVLIFLTANIIKLSTQKLQKVYYARQLADHGQTVEGEVLLASSSELYFYNKQYALIRYKFNDKYFIKRIDNQLYKFVKGSQLKIALSSQHPEIIKVIDD